ncbi:MAG TPA: DUF1415 domain-containing protein [Rubrivivax sp.]
MNRPPPPDAPRALAETQAWVDRVVIGLNLCPFAKAPQVKRQVRYRVSDASHTEALLADLLEELRRLADTLEAEIETTLLIHPQVLNDFDDYNDFLDLADRAVEELGLEGTIQVASFHPQYRFEGTTDDDLGNATNRSPYPTLHLLREDSIERAVEAFPEAETIFEANIGTMQRLGADGWAALQQQCRDDAAAASAP